MQKLLVQSAAVQGELLQARHILERSDDFNTVGKRQVIVSHGDLLDLHVDSDSVGQHTERIVAKVVVRHVHLLEVSHLDQVVSEGLHLSVRQSRLNEVQALDRSHLEQVSQDLTSQLVVVTVELLNFALLDLSDESLSTRVVDVIVLKLELLQGVALFHQLDDVLGTSRRNLVVSEDDSLQLLFLFVGQRVNDDLNTFVLNVIASEIQNSHGLGVSQSGLELLDTAEANIVTLKAEHFEELLVLEGLAESSGTIGEHTIVGQPQLLDVLGRLEYLGDVTSAIRANHIVREVEFSQSSVMLDSLANRDASVNTGLVVSHV